MSQRRFSLRWSAPAMLVMSLTAAQSFCPAGESGAQAADQAADSAARAGTAGLHIPAPAPPQPPSATADEQSEFMLKSARAAWSYVNREVSRAGFIGATKSYQFLTVWDMASGLAAAYSARELGFITNDVYMAFVDRALTSMEKMPLYDKAAFNRMYSSRNGAMVDSRAAVSKVGMGWSALDHGRLLIWLKVVGDDNASFEPRARAIVSRLDMTRLVKDGYMQGEEKIGTKRRPYQEGRVGYEQYAAEGFALWGAKVDRALDFSANSAPVVVNGQTIVTDKRGGDVLTSEPFVMMGLELGWTNEMWRTLSLAVLAAQEERFKQTGIVTMVSEDAIPVAPTYFYYYLLYRNGKPFVVTTVSGATSARFPRWVSAKAAFGYHALAPSDYTWRALQTVKYAGDNNGWAAGVYEGTKRSTRTYNLNTAAIVLESAAYIKRGCALIQKTCPSK